MNKIDEYCFWVMKAISTPNKNKNYYYNTQYDQLFSLIVENNEFVPSFRNEESEYSFINYDILYKLMQKVKNEDQTIILLPKLTIEDKYKFLNDYILHIENETTKSDLINELQSLVNIEELFYNVNIKKFGFPTEYKFDMARGVFLMAKVEEIYEPFGVSEKSLVVW